MPSTPTPKAIEEFSELAAQYGLVGVSGVSIESWLTDMSQQAYRQGREDAVRVFEGRIGKTLTRGTMELVYGERWKEILCEARQASEAGEGV